ncbi:MAG: hypothetical protein PHG24_00445 [Candidatus Pacebacteria bacterium]|nr:hypothetical protein [Candidatus Paceibacterota bacterium]
MKNKILILSSVILLGIVISYIVFGWSEPAGSMPSDYKTPINTSIETQDVSEGKPVITNLNVDKLDGYEASDLLALLGGSQDAAFEIIEGTSCSAGTILTSTYYRATECSLAGIQCKPIWYYNNLQMCDWEMAYFGCTTQAGWFQDRPSCSFYMWTTPCTMNATNNGCIPGTFVNQTCYGEVTHVLCLTIASPE